MSKLLKESKVGHPLEAKWTMRKLKGNHKLWNGLVDEEAKEWGMTKKGKKGGGKGTAGL
ncbi:hypothetical protein NST62_01795 [Ureibacillus sp. FSL K6-8385]|uniref:hypothetical protein n=1 Tax=Ureibacillus TaxID=160795 RepID=UPI001476FBDD|nr:hypothetical protein [Ureibacillus terrenus]MED3662622.1 hypothetical protein [Ureibacillus terrenus]MED3764588.1 hypothetical protein [Ureibacillus terrenus]